MLKYTQPALLDLRIGQYCARIAELRDSGFHITNRTERTDGIRHSFYSLILDGDWYGKPRAVVATEELFLSERSR